MTGRLTYVLPDMLIYIEFLGSSLQSSVSDHDHWVDTNNQGSRPDIDRYVVIHVSTTGDEHGIFVVRFVF